MNTSGAFLGLLRIYHIGYNNVRKCVISTFFIVLGDYYAVSSARTFWSGI